MPELMPYILIFVLISLAVFIYFKEKNPQTLFLGISFAGLVFGLLLIPISLLVEQQARTAFTIIALIFIAVLSIFPLLVIATFISNGVRILRKEGFSFKNSLSLLVGIGLIIYLVALPFILEYYPAFETNFAYIFVTFTLAYLSLLFFFYTLSNILNLIHLPNRKIDYYIVLGAGLINNKVTPLLASRINRALDLRAKTGYGKVIMSGGQGDDEDISEAEAMYKYALEKEFKPVVLLQENKSTSTEENIRFSKAIIDSDWEFDTEPKIALVSNNYHIMRALLLAKKEGVSAIGFGSKTKFYFSLNGFIRELIAYLNMTKKRQIVIVILIAVYAAFSHYLYTI